MCLTPYFRPENHGFCAPANRLCAPPGSPGLSGMDGTSALYNSLSQNFLGVSQNFDL